MISGFFGNVPNRWHTFTVKYGEIKGNLQKIFLKIMDKLIIYFSNKIFADSNSQIELLKEEKIISNERITVLGYGSISELIQKNFEMILNLKNHLGNQLIV